MPSRRHEVLAYVVPRARKSRDLDDVDKERARLERWHATLDRGFPTNAVRGFDKRYRVVEEQLPGGFPSYTLSVRGGSPDRVVVYVHGGGFVGADRPVPGEVRRAAGHRAERVGRDAGLPARPGAHLAGLARGRGPGDPARGRDLGPGGRRRRLGRGRHRPRRGADGPGPRRPAAQPPAAARALGRPDDEHPRDRGRHARGPVAVHREDARLRVLVGRLRGGPRPARGVPGPRRPVRPPAGADVLRHPGHPDARLPAAGPPGRRGRLGPHLRRAARPAARLPDPAVHPRGQAGLAHDAWSSCE